MVVVLSGGLLLNWKRYRESTMVVLKKFVAMCLTSQKSDNNNASFRFSAVMGTRILTRTPLDFHDLIGNEFFEKSAKLSGGIKNIYFLFGRIKRGNVFVSRFFWVSENACFR